MDNRTIEEIRKNETLLIEEIKGLIEENQELKKQLEVGKEQYNDLVEEKENLQEQLSNSHQINAQQKEFIEYLEKEIKETETTIEMLCDTNSCRIPYLQNKNRLLKEILLNYKEIIGSETNERWRTAFNL